MEAEGLAVEELTPGAVERFVAERRRVGYQSSVSPKSLRPLLGHLGQLGVLPAGDGEPLTPVDRLLAHGWQAGLRDPDAARPSGCAAARSRSWDSMTWTGGRASS
jgi:hypothetical protein